MKTPRPLLRLLAGGVLLAAVLFLACATLLVFDGLTDNIGPSDVAIVPGSKVNPDGAPSARLAARLDRARSLYQAGLVRAVIVSGGTGVEGFDEAEVMKDWLVAHGVAASAILVDSAGVTTGATARNSAALMQSHGLKTATVATQYFHVPRTALALRKAGVAVAHTAHARIFEWRDLYSIPREVVGYAAYLVR